ncbi:MAG TPA: hypothetical protein VHC50_11195 [Puia sp.]|nr:hypothetical protein [Puia sp.]
MAVIATADSDKVAATQNHIFSFFSRVPIYIFFIHSRSRMGIAGNEQQADHSRKSSATQENKSKKHTI